jgi:hypothetical protein
MAVRLSLAACLVALALSCTCGKETKLDEEPAGGADTALSVTARIVFVEGNVRVKRAGSMEWLEATHNIELATDDKLRTLRDSFATIQFVEGGLLRVGPESLVSVTDLRLEPRNKVQRFTFTLVEGKVEAELDALEKAGSEFRVRTPSAEASVLRREVAFQ